MRGIGIMKIEKVTENKREYLNLLLMADPQEDMIEKYLDSGDMFLLYEEEQVQTVAVVVKSKNRSCELKNIATREEARGRGFGRIMVHYLCEYYAEFCDTMYVGTGNIARSIDFYKKCGFTNSHIVINYFVDHYRHPVFDDGQLLTDMVYLKKHLDSEVNVRRVVDLAMEAGRILLKNGGEIFRVEETIQHICHRFHVDDIDVFTLSHAIFINAQTGAEDSYTTIKNIPLSGAHLGIVAEVNDLSREIAAGNVGLEEAFTRLEEIEKMPPKKSYFQVLAAGIASACFGFLLGAQPMESFVSFGIGCMVCIWLQIGQRHHMSKIVVNIVGGAIITALAIAALFIITVPMRLEGMIIGSIMPLVPGVAFTNAIRDIADSDFLSGTVRMIDALLVFVYIAIGVGAVLGVFNGMIGGLAI